MNLTPASTPVRTLLNFDGAIFDFNGTLSDDEGILRGLFIELARSECGVTLTELEYQELMAGRSDQEIAELIFERMAAPVADLTDFLQRLDAGYNRVVAQESPIRQGARELVARLYEAGIPLAVVTGASRATVIPALDRAGLLEKFSVIVTHEDVSQGKPHPEGLQKAAAALGLHPAQNVVVFEDSLPGLGAIKAAGMIGICVQGTHPLPVLQAHVQTIVPALSLECLKLNL